MSSQASAAFTINILGPGFFSSITVSSWKWSFKHCLLKVRGNDWALSFKTAVWWSGTTHTYILASTTWTPPPFLEWQSLGNHCNLRNLYIKRPQHIQSRGKGRFRGIWPGIQMLELKSCVCEEVCMKLQVFSTFKKNYSVTWNSKWRYIHH